MPFVKVVKNKAYYMRYQVKFRRRRAGKTDYQQRRGLVIQDKNKYNAKKYRLVVRIGNKNVTCQIMYSTIKGDVCMEAAYSNELPGFGCKVGLTNYAACYATGLLIARRMLTKLKLADTYQGNTDEINGEYYMIEESEDEEASRPFRCYLDVGLARTSTGANLFGCLKGAVDGGLQIPHDDKRFPGFDTEEKSLDAETHAKYIFGGHVGDYMEELEEDDTTEFQRKFAVYIANGINSENMKEMLEKTHAAIRANPARAVSKQAGKDFTGFKPKGRKARLSRQQRQDKVKQKLASFNRQFATAE